MPPGTRLDLDVTEVRECQEAALLTLARIVMAGKVRCILRGLTQHQARVLEYLGAQVEQVPAHQVDVD